MTDTLAKSLWLLQWLTREAIVDDNVQWRLSCNADHQHQVPERRNGNTTYGNLIPKRLLRNTVYQMIPVRIGAPRKREVQQHTFKQCVGACRSLLSQGCCLCIVPPLGVGRIRDNFPFPADRQEPQRLRCVDGNLLLEECALYLDDDQVMQYFLH